MRHRPPREAQEPLRAVCSVHIDLHVDNLDAADRLRQPEDSWLSYVARVEREHPGFPIAPTVYITLEELQEI
jgi:hypothetical protein